jgi:hypothetical protein
VANNIKVILIDQTGAEYDVSYIQEIPISLNLLIADVRSPDKRNSSFSKTITFPGTKEIDRFFSLIWKINLELTTFDPRLKCGIRYYVNEKIQLKGDLQLLNIEVDALSKEVTYYTSAFGKLGNLFVEIGDKLITGNPDSALDIDISADDHVLNLTNVTNSWTGANNYVYGLIDYGKNLGDPTNFYLKHLRPAIRKKVLLDKIFANAGYTYTSTFLNSAEYNNFVLPSTEENLLASPTDLANSEFYAGAVGFPQVINYPLFLNTNGSASPGSYTWNPSSSFNFPAPPTQYYNVIFNDDSTPPLNDPSNSYNTTTGFLSFPSTPTPLRTYSALVYFQLSFNLPSLSTTYIYATGQVNIQLGNAFNSINILWNTLPGGPNFGPGINNVTGWYSIPVVLNNVPWTNIGTVNIALDYAFEVKYFTSAVLPVVINTSSIDISIGTSSFGGQSWYNAKLIDNTIQEGFNVEINQVLPTQTKQIDFLTSEIKLHNLYMELDPNNDKNYIIEPRETFYSGNLDWTDKLDLSRKYKVSPVSLLDAKRYEYTYQSDADKYNKDYFDDYKEVYGFGYHDNTSDFVKPTVKSDVIYAATPIVGNNVNGLVIPKFYKEENSVIKNVKCKIRSLYYAGLTTMNYGSWNLIHATGTTTYNTYPYVGHNDNPYNPTKDYNWGLPRHVYYTYPSTSYTTNNLYNRFYSRQVNQLTDQNSRIVTAWFNLDELDIKNFSFRNVVYVGHPLNAYFYVNTIKDYNVMNRQSTQVELLKLQEYDYFEPEIIPPIRPTKAGIENLGGNGEEGINNGRLSNIFGGSNNFIANGARGILLVNCTDVTVQGDVTDFVGIGLSNTTIIGIDSGKTINNTYVAPPTSKTLLVQNDFTIDGTYSTYLIDTSITGGAGLNLICTWPVAFTGLEITFKIIDATGGFEITSDDTALTIDGNALPYNTGLVLYDSLTVFMNNINNEMYIVY